MTNPHSDADVISALRGGVVVSSQVMDPRSPLGDPHLLSLLAQTAALGGAAGFRVDGPRVVADLRGATSLPIIGIWKDRASGADNYITPSVSQALELLYAGADIIAVQATSGSRPAESFAEIAAAVHSAGGLVMADISTTEEGLRAAIAGADLIATTMAGHTPQSKGSLRPALNIVSELQEQVSAPLVVEGGVWSQDHVRAAFEAGAWSVVVGSAVTAPDLITARLVSAAPNAVARR